MSFWFGLKKNKQKQDSFKHHHMFPISTAEPTAIMYLYRNLLIAKNCMVDGRLHEFCLSNCGSTTIQLHHFKKKKKEKKKKPLLSSAPRLPVQKLLRDVSSAGFLRSTLAPTSSLRWRLGVRAVLSASCV